MPTTTFYSENGALRLPENPRQDRKKYTPVAPGEPLCVEICRVAFGNTDDWMGDHKILASSWAKTNKDIRPAPRVLHFYREKLKSFETISDFSAEQFGHNLVFYTPAYNGETLSVTLDVLNVGQGGDEVIHFVKAVAASLTDLPLFAAQLPVLGTHSTTPNIASIGLELYNTISKRDELLKAELDLSFGRPHQTPLNPGRYVFVYGKVSPASFTKEYRLNIANVLVDEEGKDVSCKSGLEMPYMVIQITADERKEYVTFQSVSQQQEYMNGIVSRLEDRHLQQLIGVLDPIAELATQGQLVSNIANLKTDLDQATDAASRTRLTKLLGGEVAKLKGAVTQDLFRNSLNVGVRATRRKGKRGRPRNTKALVAKKPRKEEIIKGAIAGMHGPFSVGDLQARCPGVSLSYLRRLLAELRIQKQIRCLGRGRNAKWSNESNSSGR